MSRGKIITLTYQQIRERMDRLEGTGTYTLEQGLNGGADPEAEWPYYRNQRHGSADCVGVGMWLQGMDRYQPLEDYYGGWVNTNSVFNMPELFVRLGQDFSKVRDTDILVYPSYKDVLGRKRYGHWMTVSHAPRGAKKLSDLLVLHCSSRKAPATLTTPGFAKGKSTAWSFFRPRHRL
jgi:hypothetical protein